MKKETFDIIELVPAAKHYYGDSIKLPEILLKDGKMVKAGTVNIPLGQSRYGGPIADLPPDFIYPEDMTFVAQLDLKQIALYDKTGMLPKTGQLIFFADITENRGNVFYADVDNSELVRVVKDHEDNFYDGVLIERVFTSTENLSDRYRMEEEIENEGSDTHNESKLWDRFAGSETSKMFGIYTHCQLWEDDILEILYSHNVLLLQIGENGFNDDGVFSVLINKDDLMARKFDNCTFSWGQS